MKKLLLGVLLLSSVQILYAKELNCVISQNLEPVSVSTITTEPDKKTAIDRVEGITAYITEKENNYYVMEAYLIDYDVRGYSEGHLRHPSDKIAFALWGRERIIDISCTLL